METDFRDLFREAQGELRKREARIAALETELVEMREELDQILQAWGPKLIKYPSNKECEAVNRTPEFVVGRNAAMETACTMIRIALEGRG